MKALFFLAFVALLFSSCGSMKPVDAPEQQIEVAAKDSLVYELIIFDPGFDSFLATQPSAEFYSQHYYESWNQRYVLEWNIRHLNPLRYGDFYQTQIHYDPLVDYGLELNYRLYNYFQYIDEKYGIRLIRRRGR